MGPASRPRAAYYHEPADGNGHVLVLAASAGYKTSGIVIPNILHYDGPLVVFDPKGELYARTKDARRAMGYSAVVIDAQNGFDPFKMIAPLAAQVPSVFTPWPRRLCRSRARLPPPVNFPRHDRQPVCRPDRTFYHQK